MRWLARPLRPALPQRVKHCGGSGSVCGKKSHLSPLHPAAFSREEQEVRRQAEEATLRHEQRRKYEEDYDDDITMDDTPAEAMQPTIK